MRALLCLFACLVAIAACGGQQKPAAEGNDGLLSVHSEAPDVSALDQNGNTVRLKDFRGKHVVVYFYPKDATPGCTKEACAFRDVWDRYQAAGVQVLGVSTDDVASKKAFAEEHKLPFPVLADTSQEWARAFGVPLRMGFAKRVTFVIDPHGSVARVYRDVDPGVHAVQILVDLQRR